MDRPLARLQSTQRIIPAPWNVRTDHDVEGIAESIRVNSFRDPIEVWASTGEQRLDYPHLIVAGEGRWRAATDILNLPEIPVVEYDFDDENAAKRYSIANNRLTDLSSYDEPALLSQLEALPELDGTGFGLEDLEELRGEPEPKELPGEDDVPEAPEEPITRPGDLWVMGEHRLLCGDATNADDAARLMGDVLACWMWTDPPYGVDYVGRTKAALTIENDGAAGLRNLLDVAFAVAEGVLADGAPVYVAHPPGVLSLVFGQAFEAAGWHYHQGLVWVKDTMVLGHCDYHYKHEPILYGWRGKNRVWNAGRDQVSVFEIERPKRSEDHPTMKPVELVAACIRNSSKAAGDIGYDPFCGSGTTIIAAEKLGRRCYAMEISPAYVDVSVRRWQNATGSQAIREQDGFEFPRDEENGRDS